MGKISLTITLLAFGLVCGMAATPTSLFADDNEPVPDFVLKGPPIYMEFWKESQKFKSRPSLDTSKVLIDIFGGKYNIPRNYLVRNLSGQYRWATIKVTIPGFKPLSAETLSCFERRQQGCEPMAFDLGVGSITPELVLERRSDLFRNKEPNKYPFGYDEYDTGPDIARMETYVKNIDGHIILFKCLLDKTDSDWQNKSTCDDGFYVGTTGIHFFFRRDQVGLIPEIEAGVSQLLESFKVKDLQ